MAKKKCVQSDATESAKKRKHVSTDEKVCLEESKEIKLKKKRKKSNSEEVTSQVPKVSDKADETKEKKNKKHKQTDEPQKKKKKKKTQTEMAEPPSDLSVTRQQEEEEEEEIAGEEDLSPEERRVLERKMKKILKKEAKKKLKAEEKTIEKTEASKPIAPQQALDYLSCWAENREAWKFQKTRQTWLLQHMFDSEKIPDQPFSVLLSYLEGLRGAARDTTVQKAEALVRELGEKVEDQDMQQRAHRAKEIIQLLS